MSDYSTADETLQEVNLGGERLYVDTSTGEVVEPLVDDKFSWRERKRGTLRLADAYHAAKMDEQSERARMCATWMEYLVSHGGEDAARQLHRLNSCKQRLCPLCAARKAHVMASRLTRVLARVRQEHPDTQLIMLTLTVRNVAGADLRDALSALTRGWYRLCHRRPVERAIRGWYRAIEITRDRAHDTYHPHIHAIMVVDDAYFARSSGLYLSQAHWADMWRQSLRVDYKPVVGIQRTHGRGGDDSAVAAAVEAAKYACKDSDYLAADMPLDECARVVQTLSVALSRKRLTALGGWMLDASRALDVDMDDDADVDMVHGDGDGAGELTVHTAEWLEDYGWHWRVQDHVLLERRRNPEYEGVDGDDTVYASRLRPDG